VLAHASSSSQTEPAPAHVPAAPQRRFNVPDSYLGGLLFGGGSAVTESDCSLTHPWHPIGLGWYDGSLHDNANK
jgi:hypothetical protein